MVLQFNRTRRALWIAIALIVTAFETTCAESAIATKLEDIRERNAWLAERFLDAKPHLPFSFTYENGRAAELLASWPRKTSTKKLDDVRTQHTLAWTDPKTGLEVRCVAVEYADFPVVEWTLYLKNAGKEDTPILENIQGLDTTLQRGDEGEFVLHGNKGDWSVAEGFEPFECPLAAKTSKRFAPSGGRGSCGPDGWPYYNIQMPHGGVILAVGWPGQWASSFVRDDKDGLRITAGQELTHLKLRPGEQVRSPLIAMLFWRGTDVNQSQNLWRRWMLAHGLPRPGGKPLQPMFFCCCTGIFEKSSYRTTEADERLFMDAFVKEGIKFDYWWMDAAWYPSRSWWSDVGNWEHDTTRFPKGLRPIRDLARQHGAKFILWFEPERTGSGTWPAVNHPEWLHNGLVDFGNPEAWKWIVDRVDKRITEYGVDLYRQDFNFDPLGVWRSMDAKDRQGMAENLHIQGYLAYWDELQRRHPGLRIDTCASGGRRLDLESLRRSGGPHTRSDYIAFPGGLTNTEAGNQGQTYGLSKWLPYYGQGVYYTGEPTQQRIYTVRSYLCPALGICVDVRRNDVDWNLYRRLVAQWRQVAGCMLGDYYPLSSYSRDPAAWIAWQFDRPEQGDGMIQAFRRDKCEESSIVLRLSALDTAAQYEVTDLDAGTPLIIAGKDLTEKGLTVEIKNRPGAAIYSYRRIK
jgi:alpha-galactosidase